MYERCGKNMHSWARPHNLMWRAQRAHTRIVTPTWTHIQKQQTPYFIIFLKPEYPLVCKENSEEDREDATIDKPQSSLSISITSPSPSPQNCLTNY